MNIIIFLKVESINNDDYDEITPKKVKIRLGGVKYDADWRNTALYLYAGHLHNP